MSAYRTRAPRKGRKPHLMRPVLRLSKISRINRIKAQELIAVGAFFIFGLIVLVLMAVLLYNRLFSLRINMNDVAAMRIAPKEITYIYEICAEQNKEPQHALTAYLIYNRFFREKQTGKTKEQLKMDFFPRMDSLRKRIPEKQYAAYFSLVETLTSELKSFPVPVRSDYGAGAYMYGDAWSAKRDMCGTKNHTGCDIYDRENIPGRLPIVSMTSGSVVSKGKNGRGGMYVGIRTEKGMYCLYDNLERINETFEPGTAVMPGTLVGYMGNGGKASKNDVKGYSPSNVHIGIKIKSPASKNNFWINPYPFLRQLEDKAYAEYEI